MASKRKEEQGEDGNDISRVASYWNHDQYTFSRAYGIHGFSALPENLSPGLLSMPALL